MRQWAVSDNLWSGLCEAKDGRRLHRRKLSTRVALLAVGLSGWRNQEKESYSRIRDDADGHPSSRWVNANGT